MKSILTRLAPLLLLAPLGQAQHELFTVRHPSAVPGTPNNGAFGRWIAPTPDLDGDGRSDFVTLYSSSNTPGGPFDGVVAYSGREDRELYTVSFAGVTPGLVTLPWRPISLSDVDGDGVGDWAVTVTEIGLPPRIEVRSGASGAAIRALPGTSVQSYFGAALAEVDDINGDSVRDLLVVDPRANAQTTSMGEAYVFSGASGALLRTHTAYSTALFLPPSPSYGDLNFATAALGLGDLDADGIGDYLLSSPRSELTRGRVHAFSGGSGALLYEVTGMNFLFYGGVGRRLASLGDANGDGVDDFITNGTGPLSADGGHEARSGVDGSLLYVLNAVPSLVTPLPRLSAATADWDFDGDPDLFLSNETTVYVHDVQTGLLVDVITADVLGSQRVLGVEAGIDAQPDEQGEILVALGTEFGNPQEEIVVALARPDPDGSYHCLGPLSSAGCPCGNAGFGACVNSVGQSGQLLRLAVSSPPTLRLSASGLPPGVTCVLFAGTARLSGGANTSLGDGTLCIAGPLQRVLVLSASGIGSLDFPQGLDQLTGWQPSEERNFQVWYRDPAGPCGTGSNLTNAYQQFWLP